VRENVYHSEVVADEQASELELLLKPLEKLKESSLN
jgi:hypothetical protein